MSDLVAIAYPDLATAQDVANNAARLTKSHEMELEDLVVVERRDGGKVKLHQPSMTGAGAAGGALWGGLIGLIFLAPLLGMAVGAVTGGVGTKLSDGGIDDSFMKDLGAQLRPGAAALIVLGTAEARDELLARLKPYGGLLLHTSLNTREEQRVREALAGSAATIAGSK